MSVRTEDRSQPARAHAPTSLAVEAGIEQMHRLAVIGTMTCAIAHELNNILTPVLSYADLAIRNPEDPALAQKAILRAQEGSLRASRIISSLLGLVSTAAEASCPVSLAATFQNALKWIENDLVHRSIALQFHVEPHHTVRMPGPALEQVLTNILLNAIHAVPEAHGRISITTAQEERHSQRVTLIRISDNGRGIPKELAERIFEPFVKGPALAGTRIGTGLGLAVCRKLLADSQGTIEVEETSNRGTTFLITLPA